MRIPRNGEVAGLAAVCLIFAGVARAQLAQPLVSEQTLKQISEHVYALVGFPNIGIVVGNRGTLVIDTGLGTRNGATVMRAVEKLAKGQNLYLTTTHYHSEHTTGEQAFPPHTVLIRPVVQQEELNQRLPQHMARFREMSQQNKDLLQDVKLPTYAENRAFFDQTRTRHQPRKAIEPLLIACYGWPRQGDGTLQFDRPAL